MLCTTLDDQASVLERTAYAAEDLPLTSDNGTVDCEASCAAFPGYLTFDSMRTTYSWSPQGSAPRRTCSTASSYPRALTRSLITAPRVPRLSLPASLKAFQRSSFPSRTLAGAYLTSTTGEIFTSCGKITQPQSRPVTFRPALNPRPRR